MKKILILLLGLTFGNGVMAQDTLLIAKEYYGDFCGFAGTPPKLRILVEQLISEKNSRELNLWLNSTSLVKQAYASEAFIRLQNEGLILTCLQLDKIEALKMNDTKIPACSGCDHFHLSIKELLKNLELELPPQYVQRDSMVFSWNEKLLNVLHSGLEWEETIELMENNHVKKQTDTLCSLLYKESSVKIYKTIYRNILSSAVIRNSEIQLSEGIRVGMSLRDFLAMMGLNLNDATFDIGDLEHNTVFRFVFEGGNLKQIEYIGYVD